MALTQITYNDKSNYQSSSLANEYKVSASDMNEIKSVVNGICTQVDDSIGFKTTEVVDGTYLNKPRYRTTFTGTLTGGGTTQTIVHGLSNVKEFVAYTGFAKTSSSQFWCLPTYFNDTQYVKLRLSDTNIFFNSSTSEFSGQPYTLTVWYTKTTD